MLILIFLAANRRRIRLSQPHAAIAVAHRYASPPKKPLELYRQRFQQLVRLHRLQIPCDVKLIDDHAEPPWRTRAFSADTTLWVSLDRLNLERGRQIDDCFVAHDFLVRRQLANDAVGDVERLTEKCHRVLWIVAVRPVDLVRVQQEVAVVTPKNGRPRNIARPFTR